MSVIERKKFSEQSKVVNSLDPKFRRPFFWLDVVDQNDDDARHPFMPTEILQFTQIFTFRFFRFYRNLSVAQWHTESANVDVNIFQLQELFCSFWLGNHCYR